VRNDLVGQVRGHLRHAPCIAGGTDAATLAGEGQEPVVPAVGAAQPSEAVGQDPAAEVAAKVALHPGGDPPAHGVGVLRLGEEGLQMMLDHRVQRCFGGAAGAIDGTGGVIRRRCRGARPSTRGMGRGWGMGGHLPSHGESVGRAMAGSARRCHLRRWDRSRSPGGRARSGEGSGPAPWAAGSSVTPDRRRSASVRYPRCESIDGIPCNGEYFNADKGLRDG
jgi:hypothetical protein